MKKCHEENMSDAHQVYIKILEAIGGSVHTTHICSSNEIFTQKKQHIF